MTEIINIADKRNKATKTYNQALQQQKKADLSERTLELLALADSVQQQCVNVIAKYDTEGHLALVTIISDVLAKLAVLAEDDKKNSLTYKDVEKNLYKKYLKRKREFTNEIKE